MKKFCILLTYLFIFVCTCPLQAQTAEETRNPLRDPEKIYLFDVAIEVLSNGQIIVTENITLNAKHQKINRGIYRDLPVSLLEQTKPISLTMDGKNHPFFTERQSNFLRINFGNDNYIPAGIHTYRFVYAYTGAINFLKDYDELYWNVTGNQWDFVIDKARVHVNFPSNVDIQKNGISLYTGQQNQKYKDAQEVAPLTFETTKVLYPQQGFTIAIPFEKGAIQKPALSQRVDHVLSLPFIFSFTIFIFLMGYFISTWIKVGRDPKYMAIAQYEPPQGISPAFMYYLQNEQVDSKLLSSAILELIMKGYIEVTKTEGFITKTQLELKKTDTDDLPFEEREILRILFSGSHTLTLSQSAAPQFQRLNKAISQAFKKNAKQYIISNSSYLLKAVILTLLLGVVPFALLKNPPMIFINLHFSVFFLTFTMLINKISSKLIFGTIFTLFYGMFWIATVFQSSIDALLCQVMFLVSMWGLTFYATLIRNVTPQGQALFESVNGFKKYMKTAEVNRVAASDPIETERIFCNYLPFAFALGLSNQWIEKFSKVLSKATIEKCTAHAGGVRFISSGLSHSISTASPSGRGGSHGGGCSGGGHGGGGGGGR